MNNEIDSIRNWLITTYCPQPKKESNSSATEKQNAVTKIYLEIVGATGSQFLSKLFDTPIELRADTEKLKEYIRLRKLPVQNEKEEEFLTQLAQNPLKLTRKGLRDYVAGALVRKNLLKAPEGCIDGGVTRRVLVSTAPYSDVDVSYHVNSKYRSAEVKAKALECVIEYYTICLQKAASSEFRSPHLSQFIQDIYLRKPYPIFDTEYHKEEEGMAIGWIITVASSNSVDVDLKFVMYSARYRWNVATRDGFHAYFDVLSQNYYLYAVDNANLCDQLTFCSNLQHLQKNIIIIRDPETVSDLFFRLLHDIHQGAVPAAKDARTGVNKVILKFCINNEGNFINRYKHHCRSYDFHGRVFDFLSGLSLIISYPLKKSEEDEKIADDNSGHAMEMIGSLAVAFQQHKWTSNNAFLDYVNHFQFSQSPEAWQSFLELIWGGYLYESMTSQQVDFNFISVDEYPENTGWQVSIAPKEEKHSLVIPPLSPYEIVRRFLCALQLLEKEMGTQRLKELLIELNQVKLAKNIGDHRKIAFGLLEGLEKRPFTQIIFSHFSDADPTDFYDQIESMFPDISAEYITPRRAIHAIQKGLIEARRMQDNKLEGILTAIRSYQGRSEEQQLDLIPKMLSFCDAPLNLQNMPAVKYVLAKTCLNLLSIATRYPSIERLEQIWQLLQMMHQAFDIQQSLDVGSVFILLCKQQLQSQDPTVLCRLSNIISTYANLENGFVSDRELKVLQVEWQARLTRIIEVKSTQFNETAALSVCLECMTALSAVFPKKASVWRSLIPIVGRALLATRESNDPRDLQNTGSLILMLMQNGVYLEGVQAHSLLSLVLRLFSSIGVSRHAYKHSQEIAKNLLTVHLRHAEEDAKWQKEAQDCLLNGMLTALDQPNYHYRQCAAFLKAYVQVQPLSRKQLSHFWNVRTAIKTKNNSRIAPLFIKAMMSLNFQLATSSFKRLKPRIFSVEEQQRLESNLKAVPILRQIHGLSNPIRQADHPRIIEGLKKLITLLQSKDLKLTLVDKEKISASISTLLTSLTISPQPALFPTIETLLLEAHAKELINDETWINIISSLSRKPQTRIITQISKPFIASLAYQQRLSALKSESLLSLLHVLLEERQLEEFRQVWRLVKYMPTLSKPQFEEICNTMCQRNEVLEDVKEFVSSRMKEYPGVGRLLFEKLCSLDTMHSWELMRDLVKRGVLDSSQGDGCQKLIIYFRYIENVLNKSVTLGLNKSRLDRLQRECAQCATEQWRSFRESFEKEQRIDELNEMCQIMTTVCQREGSADSLHVLCNIYCQDAKWLSRESGHSIFKGILEFDERLGAKSFPDDLDASMASALQEAMTTNHISTTDPKEVKEILDSFIKGMLRHINAPFKGYFKSLLNLNRFFLNEILKAPQAPDTVVSQLIVKNLSNLISLLVNLEMEQELSDIEQTARKYYPDDCALALKNAKSILMAKYLASLDKERFDDAKSVLKIIQNTVLRLTKYGKDAPLQGRKVVCTILEKAVKHRTDNIVRYHINDLMLCASVIGLHNLPEDEFDQLNPIEQMKMMEEMVDYFQKSIYLLHNTWELGDQVPNIAIKMVKTAQDQRASLHYSPIAAKMKDALFQTHLSLMDSIVNNAAFDSYLCFIRYCLLHGLKTMPPTYYPFWGACLKEILDSLLELPSKMQRLDDAKRAAYEVRDQGGSNTKMISAIAKKCNDPTAHLLHVKGVEDKYRHIEKLIYEVLFALIQSPLLPHFMGIKSTQKTFSTAVELLHGSQLREEIIREKSVDPAHSIQAIVEHLMKRKAVEEELETVLFIVKATMLNFISYPDLIVNSNKVKVDRISWNEWIAHEGLQPIVQKVINGNPMLKQEVKSDSDLPVLMVIDMLNDLSAEEQTILLSKKSQKVMFDYTLKLLKTFTDSQHFHVAMMKSESNKKVNAFITCMQLYVKMMCEDELFPVFNASVDSYLSPYLTMSTLFVNAKHAYTLKKIVNDKLPVHLHFTKPEAKSSIV